MRKQLKIVFHYDIKPICRNGYVSTTDFSVSDSLSVQNVSLDENKIILDVTSMPGNSEPTVTIIQPITDKGSTLLDASSTTVGTALYINQFRLVLL